MSETFDPVLDGLSAAFARDLWRRLAYDPPRADTVHYLCHLAAQMQISAAAMYENNCCKWHADGFIDALHELQLGLEKIGGEQRLAGSYLLLALPRLEAMERALLDAMAADDA